MRVGVVLRMARVKKRQGFGFQNGAKRFRRPRRQPAQCDGAHGAKVHCMDVESKSNGLNVICLIAPSFFSNVDTIRSRCRLHHQIFACLNNSLLALLTVYTYQCNPFCRGRLGRCRSTTSSGDRIFFSCRTCLYQIAPVLPCCMQVTGLNLNLHRKLSLLSQSYIHPRGAMEGCP